MRFDASKTHDFVGQVRAIKAEIARLQGLLDEASAELSTTGFDALRLGGGKHLIPELIAGSSAFLAAEAIRAAGTPMHVRDLVRAIEERGRKINQATLVGSLFRWVKKRSVFYRAGKNTFGLIEMRKVGE